MKMITIDGIEKKIKKVEEQIRTISDMLDEEEYNSLNRKLIGYKIQKEVRSRIIEATQHLNIAYEDFTGVTYIDSVFVVLDKYMKVLMDTAMYSQIEKDKAEQDNNEEKYKEHCDRVEYALDQWIWADKILSLAEKASEDARSTLDEKEQDKIIDECVIEMLRLAEKSSETNDTEEGSLDENSIN